MIDVHNRSAGDYGVEIRLNRGPGRVGEADVTYWAHDVEDTTVDGGVGYSTARPAWPGGVMTLDWTGDEPPLEVIEVVQEEITSLYQDLARDRA